jgi:hypothetical protein
MVTLFTKSASGARKQITLVWSSASMTAQQGALDIGPLGFRARLDVAGYSRLMGAD